MRGDWYWDGGPLVKKRDFRLGECRVGARCKDAGKGSLFCVVQKMECWKSRGAGFPFLKDSAPHFQLKP